MGGCQNYGPFLDPYDNTTPNIEGTIILATTHILGLYNIGTMEKTMEATIVYGCCIGIIMEKKMEATIVYRGYRGKVEKKMDTTVVSGG